MSVLDPRIEGILRALRSVPEVSTVIADRGVGVRVYRALLAADLMVPAQAEPHLLAECRRAVLDAGFKIVRHTPSAVPDPADPQRSWDDEPPTFGPDTQQGRLLIEFYRAGHEGLTDDIAIRKAGLEGAASPWRRASSLRASGLIAYLRDDEDKHVVRVGIRGVMRSVSVVTDEGRSYAEGVLL